MQNEKMQHFIMKCVIVADKLRDIFKGKYRFSTADAARKQLLWKALRSEAGCRSLLWQSRGLNNFQKFFISPLKFPANHPK